MMKKRAAAQQRHRLLPGVDQIVVLFSGCGRRTHAEHPVLAVQQDLAVPGQVVGNQRRQPDAEVDHGAFGNVPRHPRRHLVTIELVHAALLFSAVHAAWLPASDAAAELATRTTRLTKMPGVTIASGSSAPSSTISWTCTTAHRAAVAMIGAKLRAVLRYTRLPQRSPRSALISAKSAWIGNSRT